MKNLAPVQFFGPGKGGEPKVDRDLRPTDQTSQGPDEGPDHEGPSEASGQETEGTDPESDNTDSMAGSAAIPKD